MFGVSEAVLDSYRRRYPEGTRVVLEEMYDARPIPVGTKGTVQFVDDIGTVHVDWDNGRRLGLIPSEDRFSIIHEGEVEDG